FAGLAESRLQLRAADPRRPVRQPAGIIVDLDFVQPAPGAEFNPAGIKFIVDLLAEIAAAVRTPDGKAHEAATHGIGEVAAEAVPAGANVAAPYRGEIGLGTENRNARKITMVVAPGAGENLARHLGIKEKIFVSRFIRSGAVLPWRHFRQVFLRPVHFVAADAGRVLQIEAPLELMHRRRIAQVEITAVA